MDGWGEGWLPAGLGWSYPTQHTRARMHAHTHTHTHKVGFGACGQTPAGPPPPHTHTPPPPPPPCQADQEVLYRVMMEQQKLQEMVYYGKVGGWVPACLLARGRRGACTTRWVGGCRPACWLGAGGGLARQSGWVGAGLPAGCPRGRRWACTGRGGAGRRRGPVLLAADFPLVLPRFLLLMLSSLIR